MTESRVKVKVVGVRLSDTEAMKLDELARKSERTRSQVLRMLLAQAAMVPAPDVRLREVQA